MITTVTLSPSIDKTVILDAFSETSLNRAKGVRLDPGGKGVNVSLALAALGVPSRAIGLCFDGGDIIPKALANAGAEPLFLPCPGLIRTNTKLLVLESGRTVEINEQNPAVGREQLEKLFEMISAISRGEAGGIFVLAGSLPPGVPTTVYRDIILKIKTADPSAKVILDCEGKALEEGLCAGPMMIKPNVEELERTFGVKVRSDEDIVAAGRKIIEKYGVGIILVSKGAGGAVAVTADEAVSMPAAKIEAKSAQGAGDAMVAGACLAISEGKGLRDILRYGICSAAGAVEREGTAFCGRGRFEELLDMTAGL